MSESATLGTSDSQAALEALRESEERLRLLFAYTPAAVAIFDRQMRYVFVTTQWVKSYNLNRTDLIGHTHYEIFPEIPERWKVIHQRCLAGESLSCDEDEFPRADGRTDWVRWFICPWKLASGEIGGIIMFTEVVTERKQAADQIRESEEKYRSLFQNSLDAFAYHRIITDENGKAIDYEFIDVNAAFETMTGISRERVLGKRVTEVIPGIEKSDWIELYGAVALNGERLRIERYVPELGRWYRVLGYSHRHGYFCAVFEDITDRKEVEEVLVAREEHFRALIEKSSDITILVGKDGKIKYLSPSVQRVLGFSTAAALNRSILDFVSRRDLAALRGQIRSLVETSGSELTAEVRVRHADGTWRTFSSVARNMILDPHVRALVINSRDVTERSALEYERQQLATIIEQSAAGMATTTTDGRIDYVNDAFEKITGRERSAVLQQPVQIFFAVGECEAPFRELWRKLTHGEPAMVTGRHRRKDGGQLDLEIKATPIRGRGDRIDHFAFVFRDVTHELELEQQLRQTQKLEAVGRLAAGIAHDFNNLLAGVRGFAELIASDVDLSAKHRDYANEIMRAATRATDLTEQLLAFARKGNYLLVPSDMHALIAQTIAILERTIDRRVVIAADLRADHALVIGDPSQLQSAIMHLCVNSCEAMPDGGNLRLTTTNIYADEDAVKRYNIESGPGLYLCVAVEDSGVGIEAAKLTEIFDPFFTTKSLGQGSSGLGLAGVYGCIHSHGGGIVVESVVGHGTCFRLFFPVDQAATTVETPPSLQPAQK